MPYSIKPEAISRVESLLETMLTSTSDVAFPSAVPHKLAYRLHNAISAAASFEEYGKYSSLGAKFRIRVRPGKVLCELRSKLPDALSIFKEQASKMTLEEIETGPAIVGALLQHKAHEIYFPNAILDETELVILYNWTSKNDYFIINQEDAGITVTKERTELEWQPSSQS